MTDEEAISILIKYAEKDHADESLQQAITFLKAKKNDNDFITDNNFPKYWIVAVQKTETIHYKVLHDTLQEAVERVQKRVDERDWDNLLLFPPGSPN